MDWARDSLGKDVHASSLEDFNYGLTCPTCGEPVFKKSGRRNRPHFSHYSHTANPECENYHPPLNDTPIRHLPSIHSTSIKPSKNYFCRAEIFLESSDNRVYSFNLRLPIIPFDNNKFGKLKILTWQGERFYTSYHLRRTHLIPLLPKVPLIRDVVTTECLTEAKSLINSCIARFHETGNYFQAGDFAGRLLALEEPLEWGNQYRLLTKTPLNEPPHISDLKIESVTLWEEWHIYEILLPKLSPLGGGFEKEIISQYLERNISNPLPYVYFIDPPHHIEIDGSYVYPLNTRRILLRVIGCENVGVEGGPVVERLDDEWAEISELKQGEFIVIADGREQLLGKIEQCEFFQPKGLRVIINEQSWEIFDIELYQAIRESLNEVIRVECPNLLIAEWLALDQEFETRDGQCFTLNKNEHYIVDGRNFGSLVFSIISDLTSEPNPNYGKTQARRMWLEGLIASHHGSDALVRLRKSWNDSDNCGSIEIAVSEFSWLYPYFKLEWGK